MRIQHGLIEGKYTNFIFFGKKLLLDKKYYWKIFIQYMLIYSTSEGFK